MNQSKNHSTKPFEVSLYLFELLTNLKTDTR